MNVSNVFKYYFSPQWAGKTRWPKYTMNFWLWIPLIFFFLCRFFYFWKFCYYTRNLFFNPFTKWNLLSYTLLTLGFLYFPFHSTEKFPTGFRYWLRERVTPGIYDFISYRNIPYLFYLGFILYLFCQGKARKYHQQALKLAAYKAPTKFRKKNLSKIKWLGNLFFILWLWLLYCNTCVGWYFPFNWMGK